ncbi:hypothetical protein [Hirschia maritima]|uniref:hypothetical protein n=1 Tax=Hirschia maritima TaxID=1121961 RepID=UPI0003792062|nr:hypothetical protein [Hirschia maritima]
MTLPTLSIASLFQYSALISLGILLPFMVLISIVIVAFLDRKMKPNTPLIVPVLVSFIAYSTVVIFSTAKPIEELAVLVFGHLVAWGYLARKRAKSTRKLSYSQKRMPLYPRHATPKLHPVMVQK